MNLASSSQWDAHQVDQFLSERSIPVRLAVQDGDFPLICSVWYLWDSAAQTIQCVAHQNSRLVKLLNQNPKCGFEIAPNEPPYQGVRGKAVATLTKEGAGPVLDQVIARFLGNNDQSLGKWLKSRVDDEYLITLTPQWLTSWDYSSRMSNGMKPAD